MTNISNTKKVIYQKNKRKNIINILNCYAPHMGITMKNPTESERFYKDLTKCLQDLKGRDIIILGYFNPLPAVVPLQYPVKKFSYLFNSVFL